MTTMTTSTYTTTTLDLAVAGEASTASVTTIIENADDMMIYAKASMELFVSSDNEDNTIYLDLRQNNFARVGSSNDEQMHTFINLLTHRFTREQAEALVSAFTHELAKL
jgi:hypothetical protein